MIRVLFVLALGTLMLSPFAYAGPEHRADEHAPINVMGDHVHQEGEWMSSYRYMHMFMGENRSGTGNVSDEEVLRDFMITPSDMTMQMHMVGLMYAPSDEATWMLMLPVIRKDMQHINRMGVRFRTNSQGVGDFGISVLMPFAKDNTTVWHWNLGMTAPTGSINETDDIPLGKGKRLPYAMQLGSGTWDFKPGVTVNQAFEDWSWGAQVGGILRTGRNRIGYSLGNEFTAESWVQMLLTEDLSVGVHLDYRLWSNVDGSDPAQVPTLVPTADPKSRGGKRIDLGVSVNLYTSQGPLKNHRLAVEVSWPVFENLDGPQLSTDWIVTAGWQLAY